MLIGTGYHRTGQSLSVILRTPHPQSGDHLILQAKHKIEINNLVLS